MISFLFVSFLSVFKILFVCLAGFWLERRGILDAVGRSKLSRVILWILLPALLFSKLSSSASLGNLRQWLVLPVTAVIYVGLGFFLGAFLRRIFRAPAETARVLTAATAFGNSGYIPLPLVAAVATTAALFRNDPGATDRGIAYISVYLTVYSPMFWLIGYPYLSGRSVHELKWTQVLSPPVAGALSGLFVGAVSPLHNLLIPAGAPLRPVSDVAALLAGGAIPCALLVLGANVAAARSAGRHAIPFRAVLGVIAARLLVFPLIGLALALTLHWLHLIPADPMFALVLMLEAAVPPATNLIVMCQLHERGEEAMARILFWSYLSAVPMLTVSLGLFLFALG